MNRTEYHAARKQFVFNRKISALAKHIAIDLLLCLSIAFLWVYAQPYKLYYVAIPLVAIWIFRNFSLMHDASHRAISKSVAINDAAGLLAGAICFLGFDPWRTSHLSHHLWSGNIDKDPVTAIITLYPTLPGWTQKTLTLAWRAWFPILAIAQYIVFWSLSAKIYITKPSSIKTLVSLVAPIILWGVLFIATPRAFALEILAPAVLLYLIAVEVVNFPHHLQLPQYRGDTKFAIWEQHKVARTCLYPRWFAKLVVLNFNYHIEHHMFPDAPWYYLESIHRVIRPLIGTEYNTDPYFAWILANRPKTLGEVLAGTEPTTTPAEVAAA